MSKKIDSEGNYLPFPGFTVVADVYQSNKPFFDNLYDQLQSSKLISSHYSLLPKESYHITTFTIVSRGKWNDNDWQHWIHSRLKSSLQPCHEIIESTLTSFRFRIQECSSRRLHLLVDVDEENKGKHHFVAKETGYEDGIQHCGFHITLGYQYVDFPIDNSSAVGKKKQTNAYLAAVTSEVNAMVKNALLLCCNGSTNVDQIDDVWLDAQPPHLCYYFDMLKFIPWDGVSNPFFPEESQKVRKHNRGPRKKGSVTLIGLEEQDDPFVEESVTKPSCFYEVKDDDDFFDRS